MDDAAQYSMYLSSPLQEIGIFSESSSSSLTSGQQCVMCGQEQISSSISSFILCDCKGVWYCSENCKNSYWEEEHKSWCSTIASHVIIYILIISLQTKIRLYLLLIIVLIQRFKEGANI